MKNILKIAIFICLIAAVLMMAACDSASPQSQPQNQFQKQETTPESTTALHEHTKTLMESVEPTCTETGLTVGEKCADCDEILKAQETIPATGHDLTFVPGRAATCTEWGYGACWLCSVCGEALTENGEETDVEVLAPHHDFVNNVCTRCPSVLTEDGFVLTLNEDGQSYTLSDFLADETKTEIVIPDKYHDLPITAIGNLAFSACKHLKSITLPNTLVSIGEAAFVNCTNLSFVIIPEGVTTIQDGAFTSCTELADITIPSSVTNIGILTFLSCENLTNITFGGTKEQWNAIQKGLDWDDATGHYTIHCIDGDIQK